MTMKRNYHGLTLSGVFYRDRDEWMRDLMARPELDRATRMVGISIALRINPKTRQAWPQQSTLKKETGYSIQAVKRAVGQLARGEFLAVQKKIPPGGRRAVNHYSMIHPADRD